MILKDKVVEAVLFESVTKMICALYVRDTWVILIVRELNCYLRNYRVLIDRFRSYIQW